MNVNTTPALKPQMAIRPAAATPVAAAATEAAPTPDSSSDLVVRTPQSLGSVATRSGSETGNAIATTAGGMLGLGMVIPGLYAGVLGGAVVGTMLGAGLGPAVASIASKGALGFLSTSWQTAGAAAKAGMFLGGASGMIGGWKTGTGIGNTVGRIFGAEKEKGGSDAPVPMKGLKGVYASLISGGGMAAGAAGGGILGASVAASGSLIRGLAGQGFQAAALSGMGTAALVGGAIGLATFSVIGGVGGHTIAKNTLKAFNWVKEKVTGHLQQPQAPQSAQPSEAKKTETGA